MNLNSIYRFAGLVMGLIYGAFFLLMALDSIPFEWKSKEIEGFLIHSVPGFIVLAGAITGFKRPKAGIIIFVIIAVVSTLFFHTYREISNFIVISFPALIVAMLFFVALPEKRVA